VLLKVAEERAKAQQAKPSVLSDPKMEALRKDKEKPKVSQCVANVLLTCC
jgi:hypothetical protein